MYTSLLLLLGSCLPGQNGGDGKRPLVWAADANGGVPYVFHDKEDNLVGVEVDLADALAKELGRPIQFKQYDFKTLFDGLDRKDFDFAMNGLETTSENLRKALFTRPYYAYQLQLVVRQGEKRFYSLEEAQKKDMTIGVLGGSAAVRLVNNMKSYDDQDGPFEDLQLGRIQGVLIDLLVALYYGVANVPAESKVKTSALFLKHARRTTGLEFAGPPFAGGFYGIAVHKDNKELAGQLDQALERMLHNGDLKRILQKWDLWNVDQYWLFDYMEKDKESTTPNEVTTFSRYFPVLLEGALMTVQITAYSMALAILLALPIALTRMYGPAPLRWLAVSYIEFFRGIPVLFLLYFLYFGLPGIWLPLKIDNAMYAAILGFGLNYAAYEAEVYRASIGAIPLGQWEAAASLGMTPAQTFRRIILPQSIRGILPPMTNDLVSLFKDTSLVSVIAVAELNHDYQRLSKDSGGNVNIAITTAALYLLMSVPLGYLSRYLEKRWGAR